MATWSDMGHAMRRRMGNPSSHHGSAGKSMNNTTPEQIIASGGRAYMGSDASMFNNVSGSPAVGKLMPRNNTQASDPVIANKANRQNVERKGAQHRVTARMPAPINIEASATMMNGRIVPSVSGKQAPNFTYGMEGTY